MDIIGTVVSSGKENAMRRARVNEKVNRKADVMRVDAARQLFFQVKDHKDKVSAAERELKALQREADELDAEIAEAKDEMARTGKRNPRIAEMAFAATQSPEVIAAAQVRLDLAKVALASAAERLEERERSDRLRDAAEAELDRRAVEHAEQVEALMQASATAEPEPVADAPRGRGRPSKASQ